MSYIDKSLGDGETVIARAHFHWLYITAAWLWLLIPLALLGYAYSQAQAQPDPLTIAAGILSVIGLFLFLRMMMRKWSDRDRRHQPPLCREAMACCPCAPMRSRCPISKACRSTSASWAASSAMARSDRRHRRGCGDHAHHRRSGGLCARHPDGARAYSAQRFEAAGSDKLQTACASSAGSARGKVTVTRVPWPRALSITMVPLMQFHKGAGQRQAQPGALIAALQPVIHLAEGLQRHLHIFRAHADASVGHRDRDAWRASSAIEPDTCRPSR